MKVFLAKQNQHGSTTRPNPSPCQTFLLNSQISPSTNTQAHTRYGTWEACQVSSQGRRRGEEMRRQSTSNERGRGGEGKGGEWRDTTQTAAQKPSPNWSTFGGEASSSRYRTADCFDTDGEDMRDEIRHTMPQRNRPISAKSERVKICEDIVRAARRRKKITIIIKPLRRYLLRLTSSRRAK